MSKKLLKKGLNILNEAREKGKLVSRDKSKITGESYKIISSPQSLINHQKRWTDFVKWTDEQNLKINTINKITDDVVTAYIKDRSKHGGRGGGPASYKTLQADILAINKVMYASGKKKLKDGYQLQNMGIKVDENKRKYGTYKELTGKEWKERNQSLYQCNKKMIDTLEAFGLRKREFATLTKNNSFIIDTSTNKIYVQTVGKGGKYRIVESTNRANNEMIKMYANNATLVDSIDQWKPNKEKLIRNINDENNLLKIKGYKNEHIPKHIFRSEYAKQLFDEKNAMYENNGKHKGYSSLKKSNVKQFEKWETTIGAKTGSVKAFEIVSQNLGHNRLDVLLRYLK